MHSFINIESSESHMIRFPKLFYFAMQHVLCILISRRLHATLSSDLGRAMEIGKGLVSGHLGHVYA